MDARVGYNTILFPTYLNGTTSRSPTRPPASSRATTRRTLSGTGRGCSPTRRSSTTSIRRSAAGTSSSSASIRRMPRATSRPRGSTTSRTTIQHDEPRRRSDAVRHAVRYGDDGRRHRAVRAGQLFAEATDRDRRSPVRTSQRISPGAIEPGDTMDVARHSGIRVDLVPRSLSQTNVVTWNNAGPRLSLIYDATGDGRPR